MISNGLDEQHIHTQLENSNNLMYEMPMRNCKMYQVLYMGIQSDHWKKHLQIKHFT